MPSNHQIQCQCGHLRGVLEPTQPSNHCVCYCSDCQAFARHLGTADKVLDPQGGTAIVQVPPANLRFTQGAEKLACLRLTDKGMLRWYAACCGTALGNTPPDRRVSFVGLIHTCLQADGQSLQASFGPVTMRSSVGSATRPDAPAASGLVSGIVKVLAMAAKARITGAYRNNPFFNPATGAAIASPYVLSASELGAAKHAA